MPKVAMTGFTLNGYWKNAVKIAAAEEVDLFVVELGALLHDIADSKFHNGDETIGPEIARKFLTGKRGTGRSH